MYDMMRGLSNPTGQRGFRQRPINHVSCSADTKEAKTIHMNNVYPSLISPDTGLPVTPKVPLHCFRGPIW